MEFIDFLAVLIWYAVVAAITLVILLMVLRLLITYTDMNPFTRTAINVKRWSDPLVTPVRMFLAQAGLDGKLAPLITILIAILMGWVALQFVGDVLGTVRGINTSLRFGTLSKIPGYILYLLLSVFSLLVFVRIVCTWAGLYAGGLMRFLLRVTEPVLAPFRRFVPMVGMFDISPMVALLVIRLIQEAIARALVS